MFSPLIASQMRKPNISRMSYPTIFYRYDMIDRFLTYRHQSITDPTTITIVLSKKSDSDRSIFGRHIAPRIVSSFHAVTSVYGMVLTQMGRCSIHPSTAYSTS